MKSAEQRINNIIGQLEGVKKMLKDSGNDCFSVLTQMKAVKSAVSSLSIQMLSNELDSCLENSFSQSKKERMETVIKQLIKQ